MRDTPTVVAAPYSATVGSTWPIQKRTGGAAYWSGWFIIQSVRSRWMNAARQKALVVWPDENERSESPVISPAPSRSRYHLGLRRPRLILLSWFTPIARAYASRRAI